MYLLCFSLALVVRLSGGEESITHDEVLAARRAVEFAEAAFVRQDIENSYRMLANAAKRYVSAEDLRSTVSKLHPKGYPTRIEAIEYQPIPTERELIYVFLVGERLGAKSYYYRLTMEGRSESDYKVLVVKREYRPYPTSPLRKPVPIKSPNKSNSIYSH